MDSEYIREMIQELVSAGVMTDEELARRVLENYWKNQIAVVWTVNDVRQAIGAYLEVPEEDWNTVISEEDAITVLEHAKENHDAELGLNWDTVCDIAADLGFID